MARRLPRSFFARDTRAVARELVGRVIVHLDGGVRRAARIVETEAYHGPGDEASHARFGATRRAAVMFGPPGFAYVYLIYGTSHCLNVVTGPEGFPAAVLLRAAEPLEGCLHSTRGPGNLCRALGVRRESHDRADLSRGTLWVEDGERPSGRIVSGPRVNVGYAGRWATRPWRYWLEGSRWVSGPKGAKASPRTNDLARKAGKDDKGRRMVTRNPKKLPVILLALATLATSACSSRGEKAKLPEPGPEIRAVRVARPATRIETGLARATGTLRSKDEATLAAKGTGTIHRIRVSVGDRVKAGTPLVEMDPVNAGIALENAQAAERVAAASLAAAEREVARSKTLFEAQSLPESGYDRVRTARDVAAAQLDQARAALRSAKQLVADATLTAPFDGVVTAKYRNAGDTVTLMPVTPILTVTDVDHLEARLAVPEAIDSFVRPGQVVEGVLTPSGQKFSAKVRTKGSVVDPASRTIEVLADVMLAKGQSLRPGSLVNVDFGAFGEKDGLFVPSNAVRTEEGKTYLLVVSGGKVQKLAVTVAPLNPGTVAVQGGLPADAQVIVEPGRLAPGDAVVALGD